MRLGKKSNAFTKEDLKQAHDTYYESLKWFVYYRTRDDNLTEDIIQDIFIKVWERRDGIDKKTIKNLLYRMAQNILINHAEHLDVVRKYHDRQGPGTIINEQSPLFIIEEKEFETRLNSCIDAMPESARDVFLMNRVDKLKYKEIAERLGISTKAVEKRMGVALSKIREQLGINV
ncbi:MAG: RNA polymerase sigma-70 factor [Bacteroidota bacterium]